MAFFFNHSFISAQTYFQQRTDYTIAVTLDDEQHSLKGIEKIKYVNNSMSELSSIYFHLWPNAYKDNHTALAHQLLKLKRTELYFSKEGERGYIDSLYFKVEGKHVQMEHDKLHSDICLLTLNEKLKPGDSIEITTPFYVKIPDAFFSRFGHNDQSYYVTQWYPKPAVYDAKGWHPMPYLDQGEFYSEFGSYDVSITLPEDYVVASTGNRTENANEKQFLDDRIKATQRFINEGIIEAPDSTEKRELKTIRFIQDKVHDFAWFADKDFFILNDTIKLARENKLIEASVYFTGQNYMTWKNSMTYMKDAVHFYSEKLGAYPYEKVSAVDGAIMAGSGMEYPGITVIGEVSSAMELDIVMTHEIGHNWFYGALANNERDEPFMDESLNSLYETHYIRKKYPSKKLTEMIGMDSTFSVLGLNKIQYWRINETSHIQLARTNSDQPLNLSSEEYPEKNYGGIIYSKGAMSLDHYMEWMGEDLFDSAMKDFYNEYKFRHVSLTDLDAMLEKYKPGQHNFFDNVLRSDATNDIAAVKIKKSGGAYRIRLKNKSKNEVPFNICAFRKGKPIAMKWYPAFKGRTEVIFDVDSADYFKIDGSDRMPDINRKNNLIKKGIFKRPAGTELTFLTSMEDPLKKELYFVPVIAGNFYNGLLAGATFHNYGIYPKRFEFLIAPLYGFRSQTPAGVAEAEYKFYPERKFSILSAGLKIKSFAYDVFETSWTNKEFGTSYLDLFFNYYKFTPYITYSFRKHALSEINHRLTVSHTLLFTDSLSLKGHKPGSPPRAKLARTDLSRLIYELQSTHVINPYSVQIQLQQAGSMLKLAGTYGQRIQMGERNYFSLRIFAGSFISGSPRERAYYAFRASGYSGYQDYLFDHNFIARNVPEGLGFIQYGEEDGAMKVRTPLGQSSEWLAGINIHSPYAGPVPLRLFADIVTCDGRSLLEEKFLWDAGINLTLWKDIIEIYFPLLYSRDIRKVMDLNNITIPERIRFTLNIHKLGPKNLIQNKLI
jgi:hypothetical protein